MMHRTRALAAALSCVSFCLIPAAVLSKDVPALAANMVIAGWVENGWIGEPPVKVQVKLDSGAATSSINAPHYRSYRHAGKMHVSFALTGADGQAVNIERPVERMVVIRRAGTVTQERPVIRLQICVAGVTSDAEFTLSDRSAMTYPVLVGRSFLAGRILVDSGKMILAPDLCAAR